jgi:hypothetical protein
VNKKIILHNCEFANGFIDSQRRKKKSYCTFAGSQMVFSTHIKEEKKYIAHLWACSGFFDSHMKRKK